MIRVAAMDDHYWFKWTVAIPGNALKGSVMDVAARASALAVPGVDVSSSEQVAFEVPKAFDDRLKKGERAAINNRLLELGERVVDYRVSSFPPDEQGRRSVLEFAKNLVGWPIIVVPGAAASSAADIDRLAAEYDVYVAFESKSDPTPLVAALGGMSPHVGVAGDLTAWIRAGVPVDKAVAAAGSRLFSMRIPDPASNRSVVENFLITAWSAKVKPLAITIDTPVSGTEADLKKTLDAFEQVMLPVMAQRVREVLATPDGQIRSADRLSADARAKVEAAIPHTAIATPRKPRKLLVTDMNMYSGHPTVVHGNYLLERMGALTGAYTPTFSNDLAMLKYPKIKEFDAIYLNNVVGMVYNDPDVRESLLRYVREGGGIGGHHGVTFFNNNWPEFAEMMGGWAGLHRVEEQFIKIDDPNSPLTKSFGTESFAHTDEFYQFPMYSPYSREKQHVLLSIDVEKSDRASGGTFCTGCTRSDQDYGVSWIKEYGKGKTFFTSMGHTESFYEDPRWAQHLLAGIQYILGDLDADATPSAKLPKGQTSSRK
jgi:type 1 glutamine amidotransferase